MSLKPLQAQSPLGQFDGLDAEYLLLLGGEVVGFGSTGVPSTDLEAYDVKDGYSGTVNKNRPVVTKTLAVGMRPLFLADEGITGYGTLFGSVVGGVVGQVVVGGATLGPSTATGSGKVTCWDQPGLYAVSLDAVDTTASTGLVVLNNSLQPGTALYATTAGKLTPAIGSAFEAVVVARFIEFTTNGSLVTTPGSLIWALNSPTPVAGIQSSGKPSYFTFATIHFGGGLQG